MLLPMMEVAVKRCVVTLILSGLSAVFTLGLSGCGGSSSTQPITVSVTASVKGIDQAQTATVTAAVSNDSKSAGVQWSVSGGGSLSGQSATSATFNAPASVTTAFTATVTASSVTDSTRLASVQIKVSPLPTVTTLSLPAATAGVAYNAPLAVSGGTSPFTWSVIAGTLAPLNLNSSTGVISGTPTGVSSGSVTFKVVDAAGNSATQSMTLTTNPPATLTIATVSLPGAGIGAAYSQNLQASGGVPPFTWIRTAGTLPAGLTLSSSGLISGIPAGPIGTSSFAVQVTDSQTPTPATKTANLSIVVSTAPLSITRLHWLGDLSGTHTAKTSSHWGNSRIQLEHPCWHAPAWVDAECKYRPDFGHTCGCGHFRLHGESHRLRSAAIATAQLSIVINSTLTIVTTSLPGGSVGRILQLDCRSQRRCTPLHVEYCQRKPTGRARHKLRHGSHLGHTERYWDIELQRHGYRFRKPGKRRSRTTFDHDCDVQLSPTTAP